ncbi:MAG: anthranilate phosphoribosyltransferase, partial [Vampirovibrio sp.]|nr:anthranilate phosphoribosyltransferase [Vampirovibrio sp.]
MLTPEKTEDFILGRLPEPETLALLKHLTPDVVDTQTFQLLLETMSKTASPLPQLDELDIIDCCGTGGSGRTHFNTSTTVAFVLAAAGLPVVKFGNRGLTSKSGSFDFLEALGLTAEIPLDHIGDLLQEGGVTFLYAPQCYPALAPFNQLRRGLGTRTVFNYLGPMLNPVKPTYRLLGVSQIDMQEKIANRLLNDASSKRAWVVSGPKGMDELMPVGTNIVMAVENQSVKVQELSVDWTGPPLDEDTVLS